MSVWVCDWTHWQGEPLPAAAVEAEGYGMVKLKVGGAKKQGWSFIDPTFFESAFNLLRTSMIPAAYWYLVPNNPYAQAGLFYDTLLKVERPYEWATFLDLEEPGVTWEDVIRFFECWNAITHEKPLAIYTSKRFWDHYMGEGIGRLLSLFLEEAHWVSWEARHDPDKPYASQQAKAIDPNWWNIPYGGWTGPSMIQFTDYALVVGRRVTASIFRGDETSLRDALL